MAKLQDERDFLNSFYGDEYIVEPSNSCVPDFKQLDELEEAISLYAYFLDEALFYRPDNHAEIALLRKELQEAKVQKREILSRMKNIAGNVSKTEETAA